MFSACLLGRSSRRYYPRQDMDLLNENRSLIHTGKFLRRPETRFGCGGWTELFALLFDNYRRGLAVPCVFFNPHELPDSCYDETQGEGRNHKIPSIPTRKSRGLISCRTTDFSLDA